MTETKEHGEVHAGSEQAAMIHEKRLRCLELRKAGWPYEQIAREEGYRSRAGAFRAVSRLLESMAEEPAECVRKIELERLSSLLTAIWPKASQGDLEAIDRVLAIHERICAITGIDGPSPPQPQAAPSATAAQQNVDQLLQEVLNEDTSTGAQAVSTGSTQARFAPSKSAPAKTAPSAPARSVEKPAAQAPKTKPKLALNGVVPDVPRKHWITLGVLSLALVVVWSLSSRGTPSAEQLTRTALNDPDKASRAEAAAALIMIQQPDPTDFLRQLAAKSRDAEVLIQALNGLSTRGDVSSLPLFFSALENPDGMVRAAAWTAVQKFYNGALPEGLEYQPDALPEERARVARRLKEIREQLLAKVPKDAKV